MSVQHFKSLLFKSAQIRQEIEKEHQRSNPTSSHQSIKPVMTLMTMMMTITAAIKNKDITALESIIRRKVKCPLHGSF
jgi:hypothetical protein